MYKNDAAVKLPTSRIACAASCDSLDGFPFSTLHFTRGPNVGAYMGSSW